MTIHSKLPIAWYTGCKTPEEKQERENLVRNSVAFATLLLRIFGEKYETIEKKGLREEDYEDDNWVFKQAFRNGKLAALTELAEMFNYLGKSG